jgi:acylphosphatase
MERRAVRLSIRGRVQGVGYRWWAVRAAEALGLDGWVRNRADGSVELLAVGEPAAVARMTEACRQGPRAAAVTAVEVAEAADEGVPGFHEWPTA